MHQDGRRVGTSLQSAAVVNAASTYMSMVKVRERGPG